MQSNHISNQIPHWGEKPYYSLDYYLRQTFGEKVYKLALDGGMTCPNRDGTLDTRGCIFCSAGGSGDFATGKCASVTEQINTAIQRLETSDKFVGRKYIAYFQSFSNTYAPAPKLRALFLEALAHPAVAGLSIGTRPDCFSPEVYDLLEECNQIAPTWIELGLQTIHEKTADLIRRGYPLSVFDNTTAELRRRQLSVIVHVILGLPGETESDILETIHYLNHCDIQGIKLQLLHVLAGTDLAESLPTLSVYTEEEYVRLVLRCISELHPNIVIHRLTGDGPKKLLLAPKWSLNKRGVLNHIARELKQQKIYQGKNWKP